MGLPFFKGQIPAAEDFNALMPKADLASSSGASLLGFIQAGGIGAVAQLVQDKLRRSIDPMDFGAVGDGVTDDTEALQKCLDYAGTVGAEIDLHNKVYAISGRLDIDGALPIYLHDGVIIATGTTWGTELDVSGSMLNINRPTGTTRRHRFSGVNLDCNFIARTGFYIYRVGSGTTFYSCHARRFSDAGFWLKAVEDGNNDVRLTNCSAAEAMFGEEPKYSTYSERTGIAFLIDTSADVTLLGCVGSASKHCLKITGDFWNFNATSCVFWNGNARDDATSVTVLIDPLVTRCQFVGCRFDDGAVKLYNFNQRFEGCEFIQFESGQLQLVATLAGETASKLVFIGNTLSDSSNPVTLSTEDVGAWGTVAAEWIGNKAYDGTPAKIQTKGLIVSGISVENGFFSINTGDQLRINGIKVVSERETGWTASTGTPNKGAYATYAGQTVSAGYVQAEAQATDDAAKANSQRIKAIEDAMRTHGLIN